MAEVMNTWEAIREGTNDVERLIGQKQYNLAMIKARQTLEIMVRTLAERNGIQATDLATAIDEMYRYRVISQTTAEHYHKIRMIGNKAAHEGDENPSGANAAYHLLSQELYTFAKDFAPSSSSARRARAAASAGRAGSGSGSGSSAGYGNTGYGNTGYGSSGRGASGYGSDSSRYGSNGGNGSNGSNGSNSGNGSYGSNGSGTGSRSGSGNSGSYSSYSNRSGSAANSRTRDREADERSVRRASHRTTKKSTITPELVFKVMIPIIALVLIFCLFKFLKSKNTEEPETEQELQIVVETTAPETQPQTEPTTEPEPETVMVYTVVPEVLNVRSQPTTDSSKLGQVKQGETLAYISDYDSEWALINYNDQEGYVNKAYIEATGVDPAALAALEAEGAEGVNSEEAGNAE